MRASSRSGSCTAVIPPGPHAIPHRPMAVSNRVNPSAGGSLASGLAIALLLRVPPILAAAAADHADLLARPAWTIGRDRLTGGRSD